jgi:hypothetical protein
MKAKRAGNVIRAQGAASKLLDLYGFEHPSQINLGAVVVDRGVTVRHGGLKGCEARLVRAGARGIIRVRDSDPKSPRSRFALAHELGHWEIHTDTQAFICTREKLRDYRNDPIEAEANTFASEFLMPTYMVRPTILGSDLSSQTASRIGSEFNVSLTAAAIRMLLETPHECFLVMSRDKHVEWWVSGSDRFGLWMESKQPLHIESVAYHLPTEVSDNVKSEVVPAEAWFLHLPSPERVEISEDSVRLGNTGFILSLLVLADTD